MCTQSSNIRRLAEGSSAQIRENAAEKLGEVAIQSPAYCHAIVQQVRNTSRILIRAATVCA